LQMNNTTVSTAGRSYDTFGRIASISNGTDTLSYTYRPGGQLSLAGWTNGQNSAMSNQSYEYDQYNRLTGIKLNNVNEVSYTLNAKDQRTAATYANAGLWNFTYDDKGQVTGANGSSKSYTYSYDGIGNRLTANENSTATNYTSNLLNQYTLINNTAPEYDADGNMTGSGNGWGYTYNGENRITQATKGSTTVTMAYDYAGRRISKTVTASGVIQNAYKYVYDGFKLIAVYNNNDLVMTFTWQPESLGMDVPVSMTYAGATYYYVTDGNKNVTALLDASGNRVAEYVYGPFGQTVSATGSIAQINPFRFSSEFHDDETGLVYYNYRYYSPELGRWTKRDPIEEDGGSNLYGFVNNAPILLSDYLGMKYTIRDTAILARRLRYAAKKSGCSKIEKYAECLCEKMRAINKDVDTFFSQYDTFVKAVSENIEKYEKYSFSDERKYLQDIADILSAFNIDKLNNVLEKSRILNALGKIDGSNAKIEKVITAYTAYRDGGGFGLMLNMAEFVSSGVPGMSDVIGLYSNIFNAARVAINNISIFSDSVAERFDGAIHRLEKNKKDCDCIATDLNTGFSNECKHFLR